MCSIDWALLASVIKQLLQPAATVTAGLLAFFGAKSIALRQIAIANRQADIADGQRIIAEQNARIAMLSHREKLFDRRYKIHARVRAYIFRLMRARGSDAIELPTKRLQWSLNRSKFLFPPNVRAAIDVALNAAEELHELYQQPLTEDNRGEMFSRRSAMRTRIRLALENVSSAMAPEMLLFDQTDRTLNAINDDQDS